jgi:hypothetical protein
MKCSLLGLDCWCTIHYSTLYVPFSCWSVHPLETNLFANIFSLYPLLPPWHVSLMRMPITRCCIELDSCQESTCLDVRAGHIVQYTWHTPFLCHIFLYMLLLITQDTLAPAGPTGK